MKLQDKITQVLNGTEDSYIFPFFWQHGEDQAVLREYMKAIYEANIRQVCVESRPHPDFAGPGLVAGYGCDSGRGRKEEYAGMDPG